MLGNFRACVGPFPDQRPYGVCRAEGPGPVVLFQSKARAEEVAASPDVLPEGKLQGEHLLARAFADSHQSFVRLGYELGQGVVKAGPSDAEGIRLGP